MISDNSTCRFFIWQLAILAILGQVGLGCSHPAKSDSENRMYVSYKKPLGDYLMTEQLSGDSLKGESQSRIIYENGAAYCESVRKLIYENRTCYFESGEIFQTTTSSELGLEGTLTQYDEQGRRMYEINYYRGEKAGGSSIFNSEGEVLKYVFWIFKEGKPGFYAEKEKNSGFIYEIPETLALPIFLYEASDPPYTVGEEIVYNIWAPCPPGFSSELKVCKDSALLDCKILLPDSLYNELHVYTLLSEKPGRFPLFIQYSLSDPDQDTLISGDVEFSVEFEN